MTTPSDHPAENRGPDEEGFAAAWTSESASLSGCELLESVAAELALGSLTGAERSAALAHLDDCQSCRRLVEDLTAAADSLLLIAAEADPPAGFEVRLLERLNATSSTAAIPATLAAGGVGAATLAAGGADTLATDRGRAGGVSADRSDGPVPVTSIEDARARSARRFTTRARVVLSAAAVVVAAAGVGLGLGVAPRTAPAVSAGGQLRIASLHPGNGTTGAPAAGEVVITSGRPSWVLMNIDLHATGWVTCQVDVNGREVPIGTFELYDGKGSWAARLQQSGAAVTSARVVDPSGQVLASAVFQT